MEREKNKRIIYSIICVVVTLIIASVFIHMSFRTLEAQYVKRLEETGEQVRIVIKQRVDASVTMLSVLAREFENYDDVHCEEAKLELVEVAGELEFTSLWIIKPDGTAITSDGSTTNATELSCFKDGMLGHSGVSEVLQLDDGEKYVIAYSPMFRGDKISGLIIGSCKLSDLREYVKVQCFGGEGDCELLLADGEVILCSENSPLNQYSNYFDFLNEKKLILQDSVSKIQDRFQNRESAIVSYRGENSYHYTYCMPIGINDWFILLSIPEGTVSRDYQGFLSSVLLIILLLVGLTILFLLLYYRQKNAVMQQLIDMDSLTGVLNRGAIEDKINELLDSTEDYEYVMLVMDIDNFKKINDQYGHLVGDKVLRKLSGILKNEFINEVVGRLGGDEFGVLISMKDSVDGEIREKVYEFSEKLKRITSIDGEQLTMSVSIGMAFAPEDGHSFNVLYRTADARMYSIKQDSKNGNI